MSNLEDQGPCFLGRRGKLARLREAPFRAVRGQVHMQVLETQVTSSDPSTVASPFLLSVTQSNRDLGSSV